MKKIHDMNQSLAYSNSGEFEPFWQEFYLAEFGENCIGAFPLDPMSEWQRRGVDRVVFLKNGRFFTIDEKVRSRDFGDCLLEFGSVCYPDGKGGYTTDKFGWAVDPKKTPDFVAIGIPSIGVCHLLPYHHLRCVTITNLEDWKAKYRIITAQNQGYVSLSVAVPWDVLHEAMAGEMRRNISVLRSQPAKKFLTTNGGHRAA